MQDIEKEFKPTSWSIDNKIVIYVITAMICLAGVMTYNSLPKENFPEVVFPQIYVAMSYQGAPEDLENLIAKEIEKEVVAISGVKKITSNSFQNYAMVLIEFQTDVDVKEAKREVQDAVDRASRELPTDRLQDPEVFEVDISEVPIMFINLSGDFDLQTLKRYAEDMEDEIEGLKEIRRVDIVGALDREIQVNLDMFKVAQAGITPFDIGQAIAAENSIIAGGEVKVDGMKRSISVNGEFASAEQIANLVVVSTKGGKVLVKDVAEVVDTHKEQESFSRLDEKNVISLNVVKRGGENLIDASDKINAIMKDFQDNKLPKGLNITITGDQSDSTRMTLHDLINTIIIGFVLVTIILMFFMGATNAIFVGLSVPISSFIAFLFFPVIGFGLNLMTLFSFLLALGIVVDDAIVVIENTHRVFDNGRVPIRKAAKIAAGEVFLPVLSGTLVVLAPFVPLAFWPGVIGSFMMYLPVTLIVALLASLVVAYIMNPVFAADFMKAHDHHSTDSKVTKGYKISAVIFAAFAIIFYAMQAFGLANFTVFIFGIYSLHRFVLEGVISKFQTKAWPYVQNGYKNWIAWFLEGARPWLVVVGIFFLFIFSIVFTAIRKPAVEFFPEGDPHFIYAYVRMPIGTHQRVTDSITNIVEDRIIKAIGTDTAIVESIISNVAVNAAEDPFSGAENQPHLGKVSVAFVDYAERDGRSSRDFLGKIREAVSGVKGAEISVDQEQGGPPTGKPINIEIAADDFTALVSTADRLKRYLDSLQIGGVEELKSDFQSDKPEISIKIDREKANREGISTRDIGMLLATSIYGNETSRFRDVNDDYPIQIRVADHQRNDINTLMNLPITYRDMASGGIVRQVPLSAIAKIEYSNSFASIKRIDQKRVISLSSNVLTDFNPNEVVGNIQKAIGDFRKRDDVEIKMTGEQEDQAETMTFLGNAGLIALGLIFIILVIQFNSTSKPLIILSEIVLSIIGVLIGFSLFNMKISIVMSGVGVMALAGIVVRNGILLVEFTDLLRSQGVELKEAIIEAARTRMTPVLLTAMAATLGLIPLAVGFNIDFVKLFTELNPHIFFGGDNVAFWGPLSWTMIFGLIFGTFLTLFFVPVMYLITARWKESLFGKAEVTHPKEAPHGSAEGTVTSI